MSLAAFVLLGAAVGIATTGFGATTRRRVVATIPFVVALPLLLADEQADAVSGVVLGYGAAVLADGVRVVVGHWRRTRPPSPPQP